jgi:hypothetical protein
LDICVGGISCWRSVGQHTHAGAAKPGCVCTIVHARCTWRAVPREGFQSRWHRAEVVCAEAVGWAGWYLCH